MPDEKTPMEGGPGPVPVQDTASGGVDVTKTVKIKLQGREFDVLPELATAHEAREQEFSRKLSEHSGELGTLRKYKQDVEPLLAQLRQPQPQSTGPNLNVLWYENPEAAAKVVEDRVAQKLESRYLQAEAIKSFWDGFYRENKDLEEDDFVVKAVFSNRYAELAPLSVRDAQTKLAEATRDELLRISRKVKAEVKKPAPATEEASGERVAAPEAKEPEGPKSVSELIAQRRQARRVGAKQT